MHRSVADAGVVGADAGGRCGPRGTEAFARRDGAHATRRSALIPGPIDFRRRLTRLAAAAAVLGLALAAPREAAAQSRDSVLRRDSLAPPSDSLRIPLRDSVRAPIRLCAGGDVTLGTNLDTIWAKAAAKKLRQDFHLGNDPESLLAPLKPLFSDADVALVNVEGAIGDGFAPPKCGKRALNCFAFRQPVGTAAALRTLTDSGVVVGNVANNHARDAGDDGFLISFSHLNRAGVLVTGADTLATSVATRRGDTIAVLGFYTSSDSPDARDLDAVRRHVKRAVDRWGTVIVTMHLGAEGAGAQRTRDSTELFLGTIDRGNPVAFANAALESGATMVIGHGPHVLRAAEWRDDRLVFYSLGNLLTYGPFRLLEPMNRGVVVCADIDSARHVRSAWLRPTMQLAPGVLRVDTTQRAALLVDSLSALDFPVTGALIGVDGVLRRRTPADTMPPPPAPPPAASGDTITTAKALEPQRTQRTRRNRPNASDPNSQEPEPSSSSVSSASSVFHTNDLLSSLPSGIP